MHDLISVVVPVYNVERYLRECVQSILDQTYSELEIILIDDGSTDKSGIICDELAEKNEKIKVLHKKNGGLSSARNMGISIARGNWIGFVDSDDIIHRDMYKTLSELIADDKNVKIAQIGMRSFPDGDPPFFSGENVSQEVRGELYAEDFLRQLLMHTGDASLCTKLCSIELFQTVRFNEKIQNEDFEFLLQLIRYHSGLKIVYLNEELYYYRIRKNSITHSGFSKAIIDSIYNADVAYQLVDERYPHMRDIAVRFCLVQNEALLRWVPIKMMKRNNAHYVKAIKFLRKNIAAALHSPYLTIHQKRNMLAFVVCPRLAKRLYSIIYGDNYNAC